MVQLASPVLLPGLWFGWKGFVAVYLDGYMIENRRSIFLPSPVLDLLSLRPGLRGYMTQLYFRSPSLKMVGVEISLLAHSWHALILGLTWTAISLCLKLYYSWSFCETSASHALAKTFDSWIQQQQQQQQQQQNLRAEPCEAGGIVNVEFILLF